jgi:hypothetical protein
MEVFMNRRLLPKILMILVAVVITTTAFAQVKNLTIPQLQQVSRDSLLKLDTLQGGTGGKSLQQSPYWHGSDVTGADTVAVRGVVIVKPGVLTYTLARYNVYIQDTTTGQLWGGLNVLTNDTSTQAQASGITAIDTGMVVTITGRVTEFGTQNNSLTEMFNYSASNPIYTSPPLIGIGAVLPARPQPKEITVDSLAVGSKPMPSRGEQYESMYVIVRNVTVNSVDYSSGRFSFQDAAGNVGYMYDGSKYFTLRGHKLASAHYAPPPVGTQLGFLRGVVLPQGRTGTSGDYTIMPLYPGDIKVSNFAPSISNIVRTPSPPSRTSVVAVSWKVKNLNAGGHIDSSFLNYKMGGAAWVQVKVAPTSGDSLYNGTIPAANGDSLVSYYVQAYGGGVYGASPDPSIPNFYQIRQSGLTIHDIQFTPYVNGVSGFVGDTVTLNGTITADTTDIKDFVSNRPRLWMASATGAWNGMSMYDTSAAVGLDTLIRGDSVQVMGTVDQVNGHTNLRVIKRTLLLRGATPIAPTVINWKFPPGVDYSLNNLPVLGNATFEQYEGVLVHEDTSYILQVNADDPLNGGSHFGEFFIGSHGSTFGMRVDDNGCNNYYADTTTGSTGYQTAFASGHPNNPPKNRILHPGDWMTSLVAIFDVSFSEYKLEPRKNSDYGSITVGVEKIRNVVPTHYVLEQNYPNPFNPSTTISYEIPEAARVVLKVYNILGQEIMTLVDHQQNAGAYRMVFDASKLSTGVYFYQLRAGQYVTVKKMLLLK